MYVPDPHNDAVDVISESTHSITTVKAKLHCSPLSIVAGKNHDLWFTESGCNSIGHVTVSTGKVVAYAYADYENHIISNGNPNRIVMDAAGNLWYTDTSKSVIFEVKP